jgi:signal peptidase I
MDKKALLTFFYRTALILVMSIGLAILFFHFISQPFQVSGSSMSPTLSDRDYLLVDRFFLREKVFQHGDVVVFRTEEESRFLVKRVIALEGEQVEIDQSRIWVNGRVTPYQPDSAPVLDGPEMEWTVPGEHLFLVGDNLEMSRDSRIFGPVHKDNVYGRVILRYLPLNHTSWLVHPEPK